MTDPEGAQPRKRGGQPGNHNNLKHGFYARRLPVDPALVLPPENSLDDEIAMLRLSIRNILEQSTKPLDGAMELELMRTISFAAAAVNRLIKTQHYLGSFANPLRDVLRAALDQIRKDNPDSILNDHPYPKEEEWD